MLKLNRKEIRDKILACWIGKNIGGTIGGPFEGKREFLNVPGFTTDSGEPLPNDDLDLQLVWLVALEQVGARNLNAAALGEYWLDHIVPHWNEYGICKTNLRRGFLPPLSGEIGNEAWRHSNGAWIRSEIWACLAPGAPGVARSYAIYDAMVDHGVGEGTLAELFTATLESEAFFTKDIRALIDAGLAQLPAESFLARSVRLAVECYDKGETLETTRNKIVELNAELGWFQAPANVAFVVCGLLYGEGDFKKTLLAAVNCGDDTDCTGGTAGAIMGILGGTAGIPEDWRAYIGDRIVTCSLNGHFRRIYAHTCEELTDRVMRQIPLVGAARGTWAYFTDEESQRDRAALVCGASGAALMNRPRWSVDLPGNAAVYGRLGYSAEPLLKAGDTIRAEIELYAKNYISGPFWIDVDVMTPAGWTADWQRSVILQHTDRAGKGAKIAIDLTAGEMLRPTEVAVAVLKIQETAEVLTVPMVFGCR